MTNRLLASIFSISALTFFSSCTNPTHEAKVSLKDRSGTLYLEGYGPTSEVGEKAANVVSGSNQGGGVRATHDASPASDEFAKGSDASRSADSSSSKSPKVPSYAGANMAELDCADDLKTMRQAKIVWTLGGALKGASLGALFEGALAALRGGGQGAVRDAAIRGAIGGGAVGAAEGSRVGEKKGAETVAVKHQARYTEAELQQKMQDAQRFNDSVARVNAKLRQKITMASNRKVRKSILSDASNSLGQVDEQINVLENVVNDGYATSVRQEMLSKLKTLKKLRVALAETEQTARAARV